MLDLQIKQEFGKSYVVTDYLQNPEEDYLIRMITDNNIRGHLSCRISYEGNRSQLMYEVTNMISIWSEFENKYIGLEELNSIFEEIQNIYTVGNRHLLDEKYYYIDPRYMYRDIQDGRMRLLYIPGCSYGNQNRYHNLADFLLQRIDRRNDSCVQIAYHFYRMSVAETFSIAMFLNVIQKETVIRKKPESSVIEKVTNQNDYSYEEESDFEETENINWILPIISAVILITGLGTYLSFFRNSVYSVYCLIGIVISAIAAAVLWGKNIVSMVRLHNEEDIIIPMAPVKVEDYWSDEETVVLQDNTPRENEEKISGCRLEWNEKGISKCFSLKSFPIVIGKMKEEVDCLVEDSSISRIHAKIVNRDHEWYIFDLNSTNGSIVDGEKLLPGQEKRIYQDSEILLGNISMKVVI